MVFHKRLLFVTFIHGLFSAYGSIQALLINYLQPVLKPFVNQSFNDHYSIALTEAQFSWVWSSLAACNSLGIFIGAVLTGIFLGRFGSRDTSMLMRNSFALFGFALVILARPTNSFEILAIGHILAGISYAFGIALVIFISECAPDRYRGVISLTTGVGLQFWVVIGAVLALPQVFGNDRLWPYYPIVGAIPALVHFSFSWVFPRSPKFLYISELSRKQSELSISFYHGDHVDTDDVITNFDREAALSASSQTTADWKTIWSRRHLRVPFLISFVCGISPAFSGIGIRSQYSVIMLQSYGVSMDKVMLVLIILNTIAVPFTLLAPFLVEKSGRRPLMLACVSAGLASVLLMGGAELAAQYNTSKTFSSAIGFLGFILGIMSTMLGLLQLPQLLAGELCPQASRAKAAAVGGAFCILATFLTVITFPPLDNAIGGFSYMPMAFLEAICLVILFKYLPETKNRPVDEIVTEFMSRRETMEENDENDPLLSKEQ